jgi:hypothetical protein
MDMGGREVGLALPGVRLVTRTIPVVINRCFLPYALLGLPLPGGVRLVTRTILAVMNWCLDCEITR